VYRSIVDVITMIEAKLAGQAVTVAGHFVMVIRLVVRIVEVTN